MDKIIDLHTHSTFSDGELTPEELINKSIERGIKILSITDHNTAAPHLHLKNKNIHDNIKIIKGIEYSCGIEKGKLHILGYGIDIENKNIIKKEKELINKSLNKILSLIDILNQNYQIKLSQDCIDNLLKKNYQLSRVNLAQTLIDEGYVISIKEAFKRYLDPAYEKIKFSYLKPSYEEIIHLIKNSKGIPVLAHPSTLKKTYIELIDLLKKLKSCGLEGMEVYHSIHSYNETNLYKEIANNQHLLISGGSDYHGSNVKRKIELGTGINDNLKIKELSILKKL